MTALKVTFKKDRNGKDDCDVFFPMIVLIPSRKSSFAFWHTNKKHHLGAYSACKDSVTCRVCVAPFCTLSQHTVTWCPLLNGQVLSLVPLPLLGLARWAAVPLDHLPWLWPPWGKNRPVREPTSEGKWAEEGCTNMPAYNYNLTPQAVAQWKPQLFRRGIYNLTFSF